MPVLDISVELADHLRIDSHFPHFRQSETATSLVRVIDNDAMKLLEDSESVSISK